MKELIEKAWEDRSLVQTPEVQSAIRAIIEELDKGKKRVAEPGPDNTWIVNDWIKKAVILYFPIQKMQTLHAGPMEFYDKMDLKKATKHWVFVLCRTLWPVTERTSPKEPS